MNRQVPANGACYRAGGGWDTEPTPVTPMLYGGTEMPLELTMAFPSEITPFGLGFRPR